MRTVRYSSATLFLAGILMACMLFIGSLTILPITTHAASISDSDIDAQEEVVRVEAREAVEAYLRLLLYGLIQKLEMRIDAQA